ncbi:hypothetical protein [Pontibacillus yanchengensis]|uniref:Bacteriocin n=1 Tax=Pontibacillus yanchengensis Y32 TaxID=1385514 RepID=A0A0A2TGJ0_9BACI|nr:hypothetical protein [Pontibacillus yanchengensis]KGP74689.1 hypothetical protein N782_00530 [Pontibacillus yanchengensis Y32]
MKKMSKKLKVFSVSTVVGLTFFSFSLGANAQTDYVSGDELNKIESVEGGAKKESSFWGGIAVGVVSAAVYDAGKAAGDWLNDQYNAQLEAGAYDAAPEAQYYGVGGASKEKVSAGEVTEFGR